jgi:hypothetical protein
MYIHQKIASVTRPVKELKGFQRITLKPGKKKTVEFTITPDSLSMLNVDMHKVVEPGAFEIMVGPDSRQTSTVVLNVGGGEAIAHYMPPAPAGSESGLVSNFDDMKTKASYGQWQTTSDGEMGGKSKASIQVVAGGASGSQGALEVTGEIVSGADFTWAGASFIPGSSPEEPVNLSSKKMISFWAKGDGKRYTLALMTESTQGSMPGIQPFVAGPDWKQYSFPISAFNTDGHDMTGLSFVHFQEPGPFEFQIDVVEIK